MPLPSIDTDNTETATGETRPSHLPETFLARAFEALRYREYRLIWYGQVFASMATWMDEVTRGWLMYQLTNSAVQLGLVSGIQAIPLLLLSPIAGSAADRYSRKMQVMASQIVNAMVYAVTALLIISGRIKPWHLYVTAFLMAVTQTFQQPARVAMVSEAVPLRCLTNAIGLNSMVFNVARSIGPALAGALIAVIGTGGTYSVQAVCFFLASICVVQLRSPHLAAVRADGHSRGGESFLGSIVEGWKFSWRNEAVRIGLLTVMVVSLFIIPFRTLLPVFARDLLGVGATGQGLLLTAMGIGAMCSSVMIMSAGDSLPRGKMMLGSVALYGVILIIFASSSWFRLSLIMMVVAGICNVNAHALVQTVIQTHSPPEFHGRTMALFSMGLVVMTIGSILIGTLSSFLGARWAVALMGAVGTLTMIILYVAMPRARHIR